MATVLDNVIQSCGEGDWQFVLYKPEDKVVGPYSGELQTSKDSHRVWIAAADGTQKKDCVVSIPSQNIAYVENVWYLEE